MRNLAIFDDRGLVCNSMSDADLMTCFAYLKNPEATLALIPENEKDEFKKKYERQTTGTLYLVRIMTVHEK